MKNAVVFEASRTGYSIKQVADRAMTVGELIELLSDYDEDRLFILSHDNGYTFGSVTMSEYYEADDIESDDWD